MTDVATKTRALLLDIEGTTTPIQFVYDVLFPYARQHLSEYFEANRDSSDLSADVELLAWLVRNEGPDLERVLVAYNAGRAKLARWIRDAGSYAAWRTQYAETSDTLAYAQQVLEFRDRFIERGVIEPRPPPPAQDTTSPGN